MERQGLGYDDLRAIKSDIISVSIKMWGNDGPLGYQTGYAPCFAALAGLASVVGYEGGPPLGASMRYGDSTVGAASAFAAVAALHASRTHRRGPIRRRVGGRGADVDDRRPAARTGIGRAGTGARRQPASRMAPHGCYPCSGGDWIAIAVADDAEDGCARSGRRHARTTRGGDTSPTSPEPHDAHRRHSRTRAADWSARVCRSANKSATSLDVIGDELLWAARPVPVRHPTTLEGQRPVLGPSWRMSREPGADRTRRPRPR